MSGKTNKSAKRVQKYASDDFKAISTEVANMMQGKRQDLTQGGGNYLGQVLTIFGASKSFPYEGGNPYIGFPINKEQDAALSWGKIASWSRLTDQQRAELEVEWLDGYSEENAFAFSEGSYEEQIGEFVDACDNDGEHPTALIIGLAPHPRFKDSQVVIFNDFSE